MTVDEQRSLFRKFSAHPQLCGAFTRSWSCLGAPVRAEGRLGVSIPGLRILQSEPGDPSESTDDRLWIPPPNFLSVDAVAILDRGTLIRMLQLTIAHHHDFKAEGVAHSNSSPSPVHREEDGADGGHQALCPACQDRLKLASLSRPSHNVAGTYALLAIWLLLVFFMTWHRTQIPNSMVDLHLHRHWHLERIGVFHIPSVTIYHHDDESIILFAPLGLEFDADQRRSNPYDITGNLKVARPQRAVEDGCRICEFAVSPVRLQCYRPHIHDCSTAPPATGLFPTCSAPRTLPPPTPRIMRTSARARPHRPARHPTAVLAGTTLRRGDSAPCLAYAAACDAALATSLMHLLLACLANVGSWAATAMI
ncbi:hypothetical protein DFH07DRAFT_1010196 [Mycena maculata]|uniref:Uncharacterized protein n=1 Tax=Mycena maculata TaxID=230809 RepID=A0AAD7KD73_9AGAR|nr:hypothetical protein DFH07DRAFT_1010196 [Mycena maculata]